MEVFKLLGKIAVENKDANEKIDETTKKAEGLSGVFGKIGEGTVKFGNKMLKATSIIGTAWVASVEGSREYRTEMGKLNAAFTAAGYSGEAAASAYKTLYGVIGQTDQSVEAAQQIAMLAEAEKDVAEWSALAAGVVGSFGDALQPETFYESANETLKLGKATGAYAQMLEGMGVSVEKFDAGLAACNTEAERQAYMLETTKNLLGDASKAYVENNKDIIDSNRAHGDLTDNMAKLGEMGEPILTKLIDGINQMAEYALPKLESALQWMIDNGEVTAVAIGAIATAMTIAAVAAHPYAAAVTAVVAALALMAERNADGDAYNHFFNGYTEEDLTTLQRYVDAAKEAQQAEQALYDALDRGEDGAAEDAALIAAQNKRDAALAEADAIKGLIATYNTWRSGQAESSGGEIWLDVPMRVSDDSEADMQNEVDGMTIEGVVSMVADTSGLQAAVNATGLNAYVDLLPAGITRPDSSNAVGLDRVPRDGYLIRAHKDETLLDKTDADIWRGGGASRIEALLTQLVANTMGGQQIVLDSGALVGQLAPAMDARLGALGGRRGRRN